MAVRNDGVTANNGQTILFSTWCYGEATVQNTESLAEGVDQIATVLDFRSNSGVRSLQVYDLTDSTYLSTPHTSEEMATDEYKAHEDAFNAGVYWIWGSLQAGGCYIRKSSAGFYAIGGVTCLYRDANNKYAYLIQESGRPYALAGMNDICFMYEDSFVEYDYPVINVFSTSGMRSTDTGCYVYMDWMGVAYNSNNINILTDMSQAVGVYTWSNVPLLQTSTPDRIWWSRNATPAPYNLGYTVLGYRGGQNITPVSGSVWGGSYYDPTDDSNPDKNGGTTSQDGGYGDYPSKSGNVDNSKPSDDTVTAVTTGFVTLYNPTEAQVQAFNSWLFSEATFTSALANTVKRLVADPMDFVLFLALCRFTPPSSVQQTIKFCGISTGISANKVGQFIELDCGTVEVGCDTKTFLDYNPNTKVECYLPYIGTVPLDTDNIVGSYVNIKYVVDMMSGNCVAQIKCTRSSRRAGDTNMNDVLYSFQGNCYEIVPLTGTDWRGMISATIQGAMGAVSLANGNAGGASQIASAVISDKVSVSHSGSSTGNHGYIDIQKPYLILTRPVNANPDNYGAYRGYTTNMEAKLSGVSGYTEIIPETLWIGTKSGGDFNSILKEEADMLKSICSSGIYL